MASPVSFRWFRGAGRMVALVAMLAALYQIVLAQRGNRAAPDKGPRAVGLLEFDVNGKAHLVPITIMIDGKFYDAAAYKASPVPMALDSGTVYEAVSTGVSQGLFTVSSALQSGTTWRGTGTWLSAAEVQARAAKEKARKAAKPAKKNYDDDQGGPPVLRRAASDQGADKADPAKSKGPSSPGAPTLKRSDVSSAPTPAAAPAKAAPGQASSSSSQSASSPNSSAPSSSAPSSSASSSSAPSSSANDEDPNRPQLRRGGSPQKVTDSSATANRADHATHAPAIGPSPEAQVVPAISDAGGPEPRSFAFDMKTEEESKFRGKMLALAASEVLARAKAEGGKSATASSKARPAKSREPLFDDVRLRVFDLSTNNEPVLVLTATAHLQTPAQQSTSYFVTLVEREDIYGDLHKALGNVTDTQHLDALPRLDLIDAVDIDGDGRGELLFHQVYDRGSAYVVYRVIGNQLWPLYQGAIG